MTGMKNSLISQMRYSQTDQTLHNHYHLSCEMVYIQEGGAEFTINGQEYLAKENSIVFISSYEPHSIRIVQKPYRRYFAMVQAGELERAFPSSALPGIFKNRPTGFSHCVSLKSFGREPERLFALLLEEFQGSRPLKEQMMKALMEQLLLCVYRACPENFSPLESNASGRIREIQRYIEANFSQDLQIGELAQKFYMNHCYLTHLFKKQVGYSPKQYLLLNRLSYAQELLETTDLPIFQIAFQCGFGDPNHFIRTFRENFGLSPNQFRQKNAKTPVNGLTPSQESPTSPGVDQIPKK